MCYWHVTQKETKRFFLKPKLFVWYNQAHLGGDAWSSELARMQTLACCCWHHQVPISMSFYHLLLKDHIKGSYITFLSSIILFSVIQTFLWMPSSYCQDPCIVLFSFQHTARTSRLSRLGLGHVSPLHPHACHTPLPLPRHRHRRHVCHHAVPQQHQVCLVMGEI